MSEANLGQVRGTSQATSATHTGQRKLSRLWGRLGIQLLVTLLGLVFALPFLWMISTSLKTDPQVYHVPPIWIPNPARWGNYPDALTYVPFGTYFLNTLRY